MLQGWRDGDSRALDRLTPVVYAEVHRLAQCKLAGEHAGHLLQPTALVNAERRHRRPHAGLSAPGDLMAAESDPIHLIDLDHALDELERLDPRQAKMVELRSVIRDYRIARAWLFDRLQDARGTTPAP